MNSIKHLIIGVFLCSFGVFAYANNAPDFSSITETLNEDENIVIQLQEYDNDGDTLNYTIKTSLKCILLNGTQIECPACNFNGNDTFTLIGSDYEFSSTQVINLNINLLTMRQQYRYEVTNANEDTTYSYTLTVSEEDASDIARAQQHYQLVKF